MSIISRFAPSPTGYLHVGNVRTALVNWLFTRKNNGKFILRIDDTDKVRSKEEYVTQIREDLKWLGLDWDEEFRQSSRIERYAEVQNHLIKEGRLYPCFETAEEIEIKRKMLLSRGRPPIYDRAGLNLSKDDIARLIEQGKKPHYRFKLDTSSNIEWNDLIRGKIHFEGKNLSDPILIREDGSMTYMLCSVIDDIDYNITHVVRGEDHVSNTAIGIELTRILSGNIPKFAHLSLLKSKEAKISKREGGFDIKSIREEFIEPITVSALLARLGTSVSIEPEQELGVLINDFDFNSHGKAPAIYDFEELVRLNHKILTHAPFKLVEETLTKLGINIDENFWESIKGNLTTHHDALDWAEICQTELEPIIDKNDADFLKSCSDLLPQGSWNENTWDEWIKIAKTNTDRQGKTLFLPIRRAITRRESGPELKHLLPLLGRDKVYQRLNGKKA